MTRVNIIPVSELTNRHLMAEYREITMVPAALKRSMNSKKGLDKSKISKKYILNTGHVYHFYDKGLFLYKRYNELKIELKKRNYNLDNSRLFPLSDFPKEFQNDWEYSEEEMNINRERIEQRIKEKPHLYKKRSKKK